MKLPGNSKFLKRLNRFQVFDTIRNAGVISKAEIKNITKLTPTTISEITSSMLNEGLILNAGVAESTGGRPSQLVTLNPDYGYFIGIDIDVGIIRTVLLSFDMKVLSSFEINTPAFSPFEFIEHVIEIYNNFVNNFNLSKDMIKGIGISIPGLISKDEKIELAPNLNWNEVDIKESLFSIFRNTIAIENESRLSAIAEKHVGLAKNINNFMAINIKSGVGSGIYINSQLYKGTSGNAGELGHITVKEDGPLCGCGNFGCLETMVSTPSIIKRMIMYMKQGESSILFERFDINEISLENIVNCANDGDELCLRVLQSASKYTAIGISSVINLINPRMIILGGDIILFKDILLSKVNDIVEKKALKSNRASCEIKVTELGKFSSAIGAAIHSINRFMGYEYSINAL
ncbi:ROK family protein [Caldicellulosiruptoraceae bacterium PP1]